MESITDELQEKLLLRWRTFAVDVERLMRQPAVRIAQARIPETPGVYIILNPQQRECYVGKATRNLRDRVLRKHVSGDESHAIQRSYESKYPDRTERRKFIREKMYVKWLPVSNLSRIADLERLLIWRLRTKYNRA
jgi:excinuclease UvrABC nuclease subunit